MAATPQIDALIAEIRKFRNSDRPAPIMQDIDTTYIPAWESIVNGTTTPPGGNDTDVQFNDGGAFGGNDNFIYDKTGVRVSIGDNGFQNNTTLVINRGPANHAVNFWSKGSGATNILDGDIFVGTTSWLAGHVGIGSAFTGPDTHKTVKIKETVTGALDGVTYYGLTLENIYRNTGANNPSIIGAQIIPVLDPVTSDVVDTMIGLIAEGYADTTVSVNQLTGGQIDAVFANTTGRVIAGMVGLSVSALNSSGHATALPAITGLSTLVRLFGNQPVTNSYSIHVLQTLENGGNIVNNYGLKIEEQTFGTTSCYNLFSDWTSGNSSLGKNFLGSGAQIGATDLNISRIAAGQLGIGTGLSGSVAGTLRAAGIGIAGAIAGGQVLTVTGVGSISSNWTVGGFNDAGSYKVGGVAGATGSFTTADAKTVTVTSGIVTSIV